MNVLELMKRARTRISTTVDSGVHVLGLQSTQDRARALRLSELEERILLSASPMSVSIQPQSEQVAGMLSDAVDPMVDAMVVPQAEPLQNRDSGVSKELVFVDSGAENYQQLLDDLWSNTDPSRQFDVVLLSSQRDGVEQISETLAQYSGEKLDAVHFITHGTDRAVKLGATWLDASSLSENQVLVESWSHALNSEADLLFYGCDLASNEAGRALLENIASATGADLAASIDDTGAVLLGGDWDLEFTLGDVKIDVAISYSTQVEWAGLLNTFVVTNTEASGAGSLFAAIQNANSLSGTDTITFAMTDTDSRHYFYADDGIANHLSRSTVTQTTAPPHTIIGEGDLDYLQTWWSIDVGPNGLPAITESVIINGTTQAGYTGTPIIELNGLGVSSHEIDGLTIQSGNVTIRGLAINQFSGNAIEIENGNTSNSIIGNFIGTDVSGTIQLGNGNGITVRSDGNTIGGIDEQHRNLISGNSGYAIGFWENAAENRVLQNVIGTQLNKTSPLGNQKGITFQDGATNNIIGGTNSLAGNIIANTNNAAIVLNNDAGLGNTILGNTIYGSQGIGIDHGNNGITSNSLSGSSSVLNFPVLTSAEIDGDDVTVSGSLQTSDSSTQYRIEFFGLPASLEDESHGEGQSFLGSIIVTTDNNGFANFTDIELLNTPLKSSDIVTATATLIVSQESITTGNDVAAYGLTSEFAKNQTVVLSEVSVEPETNQKGPTVKVSGATTVLEGKAYQLNLSAISHDGEEITGWDISWGDGTFSSLVGNPSLRSHIYRNPGETFNIIAQAHNSSGTWTDQDLVVSALGRNSLFQFESETGKFIGETDAYEADGIPVGMTTGPDGLLYVMDSATDQVLRYNSSTLKFIDVFIDAETDGSLKFVDGVFLSNGNMLVSALNSKQILQYDATGELINIFADNGSSGLTSPGEIIVGPDNQVYVAEVNNNQILRYETNGDFVDVLIDSTDGLNEPVQMDFGSDGRLYVASALSNRIFAVDTTLGTATEFAVVNQPSGLQFGPDGHLYVSSGADGTIVQLNGQTGSLIKTLVTAGNNNFTKGYQLGFVASQVVSVLPQAPTALSTGVTINNGAGNNVYLEAANGGELVGDLGKVTLEAVFEVKEPNTASNTILSYASESTFNELYLSILNDGHVIVGVNGMESNEYISNQSYLELLDGDTHHLAVSWDGGTGDLVIYIDGNEAESKSSFMIDTVISSSGTLLLGQDQNSTGLSPDKSFNGILYDIRIWEDVRTATEIEQHHFHKFSSLNVPDGLIANWQMTEIKSDGTIRDLVQPIKQDLSVKTAETVNGFVAGTAIDRNIVLVNAPIGTHVTTVLPTDATVDSSVAPFFSFLPDGDAEGRFAIGSRSGEIYVADNSKLQQALGTEYTVTISVRDAEGNEYIQEVDIYLVGDSSPTTMAFGEGDRSYIETSSSIIIDHYITFSDSDGASLDGAVLSVDLIKNATSNDVIGISSSGDVVNDEATSRILIQGTEVATWSRSQSSLKITFSSNATLANVQEIARLITFDNTSSSPSTNTRTVQFELIDRDFQASRINKLIYVTSINHAPTVDLTGSASGIDTDSDYEAGDLKVSLADQPKVLDGGENDTRIINIVFHGTHLDTNSEIVWLDTIPFVYGVSKSGTITIGSTLLIYDYDGGSSLDISNQKSGEPILTEDVEELISLLKYENTSLNPTLGTRTISIRAFDILNAAGNPGVARIHVKSSSGRPVLSMNSGLVAYTEGSTGDQIDATGTITDSSGSSFANSILTANMISAGTRSDRLSVQNHNSNNGVVVVVTGNQVYAGSVQVGTISGGTRFDAGNEDPLKINFNSNANRHSVEAVFQAINFSNVSDNPSQTARTVSFSLVDGEGDHSNTLTHQFSVIAVNDAPIISAPDKVSMTEGKDFTFIANELISFTDDAQGTDDVMVSLTVDNGTLTLGSAVNLQFLSGDGISDSVISFIGSIDDTNIALNGLSFSSNTNFTGDAILSITIDDHGNTGIDPGHSGSDSSEQALHSVTMTVNSSNHAPHQNGSHSSTINEGDDLTLQAGEWVDVDGDPLTFRWDLDNDGIFGETGEPTGALTTISWATLQSFGIIDDGNYQIKVQADDGQNGLTIGGMELTIKNTNPTANDDSGVKFTVSENATSFTFDVLANDFDPADGDPLSIVSFDQTGLIGNLVSNDDGTLTYSPDGQFDGLKAGETTTQSFNYTISDGDGGTSLGEVTITISGENDRPTITQSQISLIEGETISITSNNFNVTDVDHAPALLIWRMSSVTHGQFEAVANPGTEILSFSHQQVLDGDVQFVHAGSNFAPAFDVSMSDGIAVDSVIGTVTFNATPPTITTLNFSHDEGSAAAVGFVQADGLDSASPVYSILPSDDGAQFNISRKTGQLSFNTIPDFESPTDINGDNVYVVRVRVNDGSNQYSEQDIQVTVRDVNDIAPVITPGQQFSISETSSNATPVGTVLATDDDHVGSLQSWTILSGNDDGIFTIDADTGEISILDRSALDHEAATQHNLSVAVSDGIQQSTPEWVRINITDANESPTVVVEDVVVNEGLANSTVIATASATDPDSGDTLTFSIANGNSAGIFTINPTSGEISVVDNTNLRFELNPSITLTIDVRDADGLIDTETMDVTVFNVNTAPVVSAGALAPVSVSQVGALTFSRELLLRGAYDADGDLLTPVLVSQPSNGTVTINSDGSFQFKPSMSTAGDSTFSYVISDGIEASAEVVVVTVTVDGVAPLIDTTDSDTKTESASTTDSNDSGAESEKDPVMESESETTTETESTTESETSGTDTNTSAPTAVTITLNNFGVEDSDSKDELQKQAAAESQQSLEALIARLNHDGEETRVWGFRSTDFDSHSVRKVAKYADMAVRATVVRTTGTNVTSFFESTAFWNDLDELEQSISAMSESNAELESAVVGTTTAVTGGLTVGYVVWLLRGGSLLATMVSVLPSWTSFDPLPILERFEDVSKEEGDDLAGMINNSLD